MSFTLTTRTIAAFMLGAVSSAGVWLILWGWFAIPVVADKIWMVYPTLGLGLLWVWLFFKAFKDAKKP